MRKNVESIDRGFSFQDSGDSRAYIVPGVKFRNIFLVVGSPLIFVAFFTVAMSPIAMLDRSGNLSLIVGVALIVIYIYWLFFKKKKVIKQRFSIDGENFSVKGKSYPLKDVGRIMISNLYYKNYKFSSAEGNFEGMSARGAGPAIRSKRQGDSYEVSIQFGKKNVFLAQGLTGEVAEELFRNVNDFLGQS